MPTLPQAAARLRAALTRPVDPEIWFCDWRAWALVIVAVAIFDLYK